MNRLVEMAVAFERAGLMSEACRRRLQIHQSYWHHRALGVSPGESLRSVALAFQVSEDTVQIYARDRERFAGLLSDLTGLDFLPPQS